MKEAAENKNNLSKSSISRCCKGLQKTYAGFTWKIYLRKFQSKDISDAVKNNGFEVIKKLVKRNTMIWFTSDLHFFHDRILEFHPKRKRYIWKYC